jgi:hypothetical protein
MEESHMQPVANPEDIHAILSRFQTWAEKLPANGNGNGHKNGAGALEGVREIPYEEAIRQHRSRRAAQGQRRTLPARSSASPVSPRKPDLQAEPEPVAEVPSPSAVDLAVAKIAEVAATNKLEPALPLIDDAPQCPASVAIGVAVDPVASAAKPRTPRSKRISPAPLAETKNPAPIPAAATSGIIADVLPEPLTPLPRPILRNASRGRRPRPTTMAAAPIPAPTVTTHAAVTARPPLKPAVRRKPKKATALKTAAQSTVPRKSAAPLTAKPPIAGQPQFRQVLTKTVLQAERPTPPMSAPKKETNPDRTQRITTRFSPAEQRRIEKQAAESGLTVSAWLRHCALSGGTTPVHPKKAQAATAKSGSKQRRVAIANPAHVALFSQPTNSALGNWLTLLRQRFLSSPARFSEQA